MKPPGVFVAYAIMQAVVGDGPMPIYLLSVTCAIATMWGVWHAAGRDVTGLLAAAFWVAMCFDCSMHSESTALTSLAIHWERKSSRNWWLRTQNDFAPLRWEERQGAGHGRR